MVKKTHANNFDILRLIAAIFVIITHSYALLGLPETDVLYRLTLGTASLSRLGLWIFFIMSGYLVTASALSSTRVTSYIAKRTLRIVPACWVALILAALVLGPIITTVPLGEYFSASQTWAYLKGLSLFRMQYDLPGVFQTNPHVGAVNGSLWTIPYEVTLYGIPALLILVKKYMHVLRYVLFFVWITGAALHSWWSPLVDAVTVPFLQLNLWFICHFGLFFLGGALLYLFKKEVTQTGAALGLCTILWMFSWQYGYAEQITYVVLPYMLMCVAFAPAAQLQSFWNKQKQLADISYGMYIYAFPVQQLIVYYWREQLGVVTLALSAIVLTIPLAILSRTLIEMPALRLKKYVT